MKSFRPFLQPIVALFLFCAATSEARAWQRSDVFEHLTKGNGMPGDHVNCILQDRDGFLWIGTQGGLSRYDGYSNWTYKAEPSDPTTLSNNQIISFFEDRRGRFWIATAGGLNRFHPETQQFTRYEHNPDDPASLSHDMVTSIAEDQDGKLWIGTIGGLNHFDPETERFVYFTHEPGRAGSLVDNQVNAVLVDADQGLWVGTQNGLDRSLDGGRSFSHYRRDLADKRSLGADVITTLFEDSEGTLFVGTFGGGLCRYNPRRNNFRVFRYDEENPNDFHNNVSGICQDHGGNLWITTNVGITLSGLHRFDKETESFSRYSHDRANAYSLSWNYATAVHMDRSGILWVGTSRGLNKLDRTSRKFNLIRQYSGDLYNIYDNYYAIYEGEDGRLWLGLDMPMFVIYNRKTGYLKPVVVNQKGADRGAIYAIHPSQDGHMWLGSAHNGLIHYDEGVGQLRFFTHDPNDAKTVSSNYVCAIEGDTDGHLWLGTDTGLNRFDPVSEVFSVYRHDPGNPRSISDDKISVVYTSSNGTLWAGTGPSLKQNFFAGSSGLNRYHRETDDFTVYKRDPRNPNSLSDNEITCILEASSGHLWVGTNNGLNKMEPESGNFTYYLEKDGLPSPVIRGVLEGPDGELWISTTNGLSRFNPATGLFRNYGINDGTQHVRFNKTSYLQSKTGEMFFGGVRGLNAFFPDKVKDNQYTPSVMFTDFRIFGQPVPIGPDSPLKQHISLSRKVILRHFRNDLSFSFSSLHFSRPEQNKYQFYLENYEETWRPAGNQRTVSYTNLDPGSYTLHLKASNSDGVWNEEEVSLRLIITPPWWKTWWAYFLYLVIFTGLLTLFVKAQMENARRKLEAETKKEREKARLREAELAKKAAEAQARAIEADNLRKTEELEKARILQLSMLPSSLPKLAYLDISAGTQTATEVGGDYYDFRMVSDDSLIVAVGDATGHGLHAGTMVAATKSLFNALAGKESPLDFLCHASNALKDMGYHNMYMGMIVASFTSDNQLRIASAGMPFPLLYRADKAEVEELVFKTIPLGALSNYEYQQRELGLGPGDVLLLMSDGLPEMFNDQSQILGLAAVRQRFADVADRPGNEIVRALMRTGRDWAGARAQEDDVTLMVVKIRELRGEPDMTLARQAAQIPGENEGSEETESLD